MQETGRLSMLLHPKQVSSFPAQHTVRFFQSEESSKRPLPEEPLSEDADSLLLLSAAAAAARACCLAASSFSSLARSSSMDSAFTNSVDYVNVRDIPSEDGEIVGKLYDKSVGTFIEESDGWYKISSGSVEGYVKAEFCVTGDDAVSYAREVGTRIATVTTTTLALRHWKPPASLLCILR